MTTSMPPIRTAADVRAEVARVFAVLPAIDAEHAPVEWIAQDAGLDVDTCIRRIGSLAAGGEAHVKIANGSIVARKATPPVRFAPPTRAVGTLWVPTPPPRGDAYEGE